MSSLEKTRTWTPTNCDWIANFPRGFEIMLANADEINLKDLFISAVVMLSGAMITMLGISFGTDHEDDRTNDLQDAIMGSPVC